MYEIVPYSWEGGEIRQTNVVILDENGAFTIQVSLITMVSFITINILN